MDVEFCRVGVEAEERKETRPLQQGYEASTADQ